MNLSTKKACYTALMIAVTFIMIMIVRIPIPNGYIHLGDCAVFLSGYILGPVFGPLAAMIGAASADYFSGFTAYVIPTLIAKGAMAWLTAWALNRDLERKIRIGIMVFSSVVMALIYYISEIIMYGNAYSPLINIPFNFAQAMVGMAVALLLFKPLERFRIQ
ncbi:MAG: ECF transporter S component [Eubacteriaceae bacterium]|jgi:uncharacterized membrane protein|nr:ECF transporter S component [Eubacteriaceae bacterium]MDD4508361.1 ECF transporter S component [Eubacteriaceae bacterium]